MSVPAYRRNVSKLEYVNTAYRLVEYTITHSIKIPKRLTRFITNPLIDDINELYKLVLELKAAYYATEESIINNRKYLCYKILGTLDHMSALLNILYNHSPILHSDKIMLDWSNLIDSEYKLISGIKNTLKVTN